MQSFIFKAANGAIAAFCLAQYAKALVIEEKVKAKGCPFGYDKPNLAQEEETEAGAAKHTYVLLKDNGTQNWADA